MNLYKYKVLIGVIKPYQTVMRFLKPMYMDKYFVEIEAPHIGQLHDAITTEGYESIFWIAIKQLEPTFEKDGLLKDGKLNPDYEFYLLEAEQPNDRIY